MVLRRPYAFLIKYFKLIHILLFVLFSYIIYKANSILSFFKDYITYSGVINKNDFSYNKIFVIGCFILIIGIVIFIYFLMKYKNKPRLFYIIIIIASVISMILFIYLFNNIKTLIYVSMAAKKIRLFRDISRINLWLVIITSIPLLIRGLGFDIKKFDFNKDLIELDIKKEDNEEVEVEVDFKEEEVLRSGNKILRELGYYYKEYMLFINIILGIILLIIIIEFPFDKFVIHGTIREGNNLSTRNYDIIVNDSYISNRNRLSKDNSYVILKVSVKAKVNNYSLNLDGLVLEGKYGKYIPSLKYYQYFKDLGSGYRRSKLSTSEYEDYLLIYNIDSRDSEKRLRIHYLDENRKIRLSPEFID